MNKYLNLKYFSCMMNKKLLIPIIVVGIFLLIYVVAFIMNYSAYSKKYNQCVESIELSKSSIKPMREEIVLASEECYADGGCFTTCGSGCDPSKPYIWPHEIMIPFTPKSCLAVCELKCIMPP
jgi:hypothetical protein